MYGTLENNTDKSPSEAELVGTALTSCATAGANSSGRNESAPGALLAPPPPPPPLLAPASGATRSSQLEARRKRKIFSHCHIASDESGGAGVGSNEAPGVDKSARRRLIVASVICLLFMIGEIVGGLLSGSLAIATDAAHLLTDFASFMISLFAIWLSSRPASKKMSFGWYRAEVIGALLSVLMIWLVTGLLVYMAVERLRTGDFEIDATVMVVTAAAGLLVNIIMAIALNVDGHGHGHFHAHSHGHAHGHGHEHSHSHDIRNHSHLVHMDEQEEDENEDEDEDEHATVNGGSRTGSGNKLARAAAAAAAAVNPARKKEADLMTRSLIHHTNGLQEASPPHPPPPPPTKKKACKKKCPGKAASGSQQQEQQNRGRGNINVRAAFIHVVGDFLQSLGVLIAALVIYFEPSYAIVDPICTFLFSIIVLVTTLNIIRDATNVLMEGIPDGIKFIEVRDRLQTLPGVVRVHNLRIWSLSLDKIAISTHLVIDASQVSSAQALKRAIETLKSGYRFFEVTIQIEEYRDDMKDCGQCQEDEEDEPLQLAGETTPAAATTTNEPGQPSRPTTTTTTNSDGSPA